VRAVIAESVLAKHQLLILNRSRRRSPNLQIWDCRILFTVDTTKAAEQSDDCVQAVHVAEIPSRFGAAKVSDAFLAQTADQTRTQRPAKELIRAHRPNKQGVANMRTRRPMRMSHKGFSSEVDRSPRCGTLKQSFADPERSHFLGRECGLESGRKAAGDGEL
jgi:hypothetical protein